LCSIHSVINGTVHTGSFVSPPDEVLKRAIRGSGRAASFHDDYGYVQRRVDRLQLLHFLV
jgi:hypothetical protein